MNEKRLFFMDNLKMFTINLMIVFHLGLCYMAYSPEWWYVVDTEHCSLFLTGFVTWVDVFIMPMMFFISGYFGIRTLKKHGGSKWWNGRFKRIIVPWIVGVALFAAPVSYLTFFSRNAPVDFATFCRDWFFFDPVNGGSGVFFSHIQYWYLGVLTVFYLVMYIISRLDKNYLTQYDPRPNDRSMAVPLFIFVFCNVVAMDIITGFDDLWIHLSYFLVIQPCRVLPYVWAFFLGAYAWKHQWFSETGYTPSVKKWVPIFAVMTLIYPCWVLFGRFIATDPLHFIFIRGLCQAAMFTSSFFGLLAIFFKFFNGTNKFFGEMAANSYTMYYAHMQIVFPVAYFLLPLDIPWFPKWIISSIIGLFITYCVSKLLLFLPCFASSKKAKLSYSEK
ncbi:acyltransferase family protein [Anaerovibrio sp.]|uniref:acyltransferase family protein n=1 Tax=Anaerovibrio sp. TaxID=1872532 RepID=UPI003890F543